MIERTWQYLNRKQERIRYVIIQAMNYKVTARRFRVNTVVVKDSKYYILRQHIFILASVIRHANLTFSAPTMASLATAYFSMLSHERHNFVKNIILNKKFVFWYSLQLLSGTFFILLRILRGIITNEHRTSYKLPLILIWFLSNTNFLGVVEVSALLGYEAHNILEERRPRTLDAGACVTPYCSFDLFW
jgi:phosphoglycerol transferase MdoB-like AlkP superfamily enzyme